MRTLLSRNGAGAFFATATIIVLFGLSGGSFATADSLTFSGTVLTPSGGVYSEGGGVNLNNSSGGWGSGIDNQGRFEITGLQPGTYTLDVGVPPSSSYSNPAQQPITLTSSLTNFQIKVANPVLRGVLAKPDGTPTNGCVNVRNSTWTINRGSCPGPEDSGVWKIGAIDAGTYILEANVPDNSPYVSSEQKVAITDPSSTLDLGVVKFENPFIVGKVALPDGSPVPWDDDWNKRVHLSVDMWNSDWTINKHSNYDNQSKFKFGRVPTGTYTLHVNVWDSELYTGSENVTLTVPDSGLDITGTPTRLSTPQLVGTVFRPDGSTPVQNAWVNLHTEDWSQNQGSSTDQLGKYRIGGLPAGTYKLEVNPPQDMTDVIRPDPTDITITSEKQTRNITLSTASKFATGTVKKKDGTAVSCAQVNANKRGGNGWANARTNARGEYILTLAPGSWNIRVEPDRGFDCPEPDWVFVDAEAIVEFSDANTRQAEVVNFTVEKATSIVTGTAKKKDGTIITNGNINANSQTQDGRSRWTNAQIKADGTYKLYLIPGTYDLNVWTPDNRLFARNQQVSIQANQTLTVNFTLSEKLALITGTVTSKDGSPLQNIQINGNLDCGPQGCAAWSNTRTDADGKYALAATAGRWFINIDGGQTATYVYDGPQIDVYVASETATVAGIDFVLTYADVRIKGKVVDENGKPFSEFPGWAYVRPLQTTAGTFFREYGGSVNQGTFDFRVPSRLFSLAELGVHVPQNTQYSSSTGQTITLVADATIEKNIVVKKNDGGIVGRFIDSSGLPLRNCNFRAEVYANSERGQWYGTQANGDCTYQLSVLSGTYRLGYNIDQSAGFLNRPPMDDMIDIPSGKQVERDIKVLAGDVQLQVLVLDPKGEPVRRIWVWADNHEEIDEKRRHGEENRGEENFRGPGDTKSPEEVLKYCSKKENEKECKDFKLPPGSEGPGGCKDALECTKYCQKNKKECEKEFKGEDGGKDQPTSMSSRERKSRVAGLTLVKAQAKSDDEKDFFDDMINSGSETNDVGVATLSLLSEHGYTVNAGLSPESPYMPPKTGRVSFAKGEKSKSMTLQLREADGRMTGFVTWKGAAVQNGWVGCWSEDGNSNGSPIFNGTYALNYTFNSTYHCNANAQTGSTFLHSDEEAIVIGTVKTLRKNFTLGEAKFQIPPPVSESFDATQPHVITLGDETALTIPANTIATSGTVTVNANPTINIQSLETAQPLGYGYQFEAIDANGKAITKFNGNVTIRFKYTDDQLEDAGLDEASLVPSYWDSASGTWKQPANVTQDMENNVITVIADHFTAYAVVSTSGKGRGQALVPVKVKESKGVSKIVIGSGKSAKTVTPFPKFRGKVYAGTFVAQKAGQVIVAVQGGASGDPTAMKVYDINGKLRQTAFPGGRGYRGGASMLKIGDLTNDGYNEVVVSPLKGRKVYVMDFSNGRSYSVDSGATDRVVAGPVDLQRTGSMQLVTKSGSQLRVWKFAKRKFSQSSFDERKLRITSEGIERIVLPPENVSATPSSVTAGKKAVTLTITGKNLGSGSKVLLNNVIPAKKIKASGETKLTVTLNTSSLKKNKRVPLTVINAEGGQTTIKVRTK